MQFDESGSTLLEVNRTRKFHFVKISNRIAPFHFGRGYES